MNTEAISRMSGMGGIQLASPGVQQNVVEIGKKVDAPEEYRTYHFPGAETFTVRNVQYVFVSASGNHRLTTTDGKKYIVKPNWLAIEIKSAGGWSF